MMSYAASGFKKYLSTLDNYQYEKSALGLDFAWWSMPSKDIERITL